jgi:hypothetical protein
MTASKTNKETAVCIAKKRRATRNAEQTNQDVRRRSFTAGKAVAGAAHHVADNQCAGEQYTLVS